MRSCPSPRPERGPASGHPPAATSHPQLPAASQGREGTGGTGGRITTFGPPLGLISSRRAQRNRRAGAGNDEGAHGSRRTPLREDLGYFAAALSFEPAETLTE